MSYKLFDYALKKENYNLIIKIFENKDIEIDITDENGKTYLIDAVIDNNIKLVQILLDYDADINIQDDNQKTALDYAIENDNEDIVELLYQFK